MDKILLLLQLQKEAMESNSVKQLGFHAVNKIKKLISYRRAIFWTMTSDIRLTNVSGNSVIDENGPQAEWIKKIIRQHVKKNSEKETFLHVLQADGKQENGEGFFSHFAPYTGLVLFRYGENAEIIGGLWIEREKEFKEPEIKILQELGFYYACSLTLLHKYKYREFLPMINIVQPYKKFIYAAFILLAFFPVRLSITAPAEIVAVSSMTLSAPFDGILQDVKVRPGDDVSKNMIVAEMDVKSLDLQANTTNEALEASKIRLSTLQREVLSMPEKKAELNRLLSEIKTREIESEYARSRLEDAKIRAPRSGLAIYSDINDLKGKPLHTGQIIMSIADPLETELLIRVPVQSIIPLDHNFPVYFYPNAEPLSAYSAIIKTMAYKASRDPDNLMTYKMRAEFEAGTKDLRIGWKGIAKIEGQWTILIYKILRRPLITLRNITGI